MGKLSYIKVLNVLIMKAVEHLPSVTHYLTCRSVEIHLPVQGVVIRIDTLIGSLVRFLPDRGRRCALAPVLTTALVCTRSPRSYSMSRHQVQFTFC